MKDILKSLTVVEYLGPHADQTTHSSSAVRIEVQVYELYDNPRVFEDDSDIPQAEITPMPHARFENVWDEYVIISCRKRIKADPLSPDLCSQKISKEI